MLFLGFSTLGAQAQSTLLTAEDLLTACTTPEESWISFCNGFMQAAADIAALSGEACLPEGTTRTDLAILYERQASTLMESDSEIGLEVGLAIASTIIQLEYPCG